MSRHYSDVICPFRGGITHHGPATTSPAGFCAMGQPSQPLIAGPPPERR